MSHLDDLNYALFLVHRADDAIRALAETAPIVARELLAASGTWIVCQLRDPLNQPPAIYLAGDRF